MLIYLASPYTPVLNFIDRDWLLSQPEQVQAALLSQIRENRYRAVCKIAGQIMLKTDHAVFCPIAHSHPIERFGMKELQSGEFWAKQDNAILKHCDEVWVVKMPEWQQSKGIQVEIRLAEELGIPVKYIEENEFDDGPVPTIYTPESLRTSERGTAEA